MTTMPPHPARPLRALTDTALWSLLASLGDASRISQQRFLALLPEVARRRLHRKKAFPSLLACAQQLAGVFEPQSNFERPGLGIEFGIDVIDRALQGFAWQVVQFNDGLLPGFDPG